MGVGGRAYENASAAITEKFLADRREEVCRGAEPAEEWTCPNEFPCRVRSRRCKAADLVWRLREPVDVGVVGSLV